MTLRQLTAAVLAGGALALGTPTAVLAAPPETDQRTELDADGAAVLGVFGGVGVLAAVGLFVATRPRGLE
jgi:hypothetical protein